MKKSKYIGKYDFINYFTKQPAFWFFSNTEILAAIKTQLKEIEIDNEEDDEDNDGEYEFDSYEYYKEIKDELGNIDKNDPKIIEGIIIDNKSRDYVSKKFSYIENVYDLENGEYKNKKQEEIAKITEELILNNENIILFQPVFIAGDLITKPDALVKIDDLINIIETKNTTTAKRHHFLDLYFQSKVLTSCEYLEDFYFEYKLCLVKYCYADKNDVPMDLTDSFNITRVATSNSQDIRIKSLIKRGLGFEKKNKDEIEFIDNPISITHLCEENYKDLDIRADIRKPNKTAIEAKEKIIDLHLNFKNIIEKLKKHKQDLLNNKNDMVGKIVPHPNEKSYWKLSDLFPQLRALFANEGYKIFNYTGVLVDQKETTLASVKIDDDPSKYFKKQEKWEYFDSNSPNVTINKNAINALLSQLKPKKVYFDFETLNSSVRVIDNSLPFMQIITQCSIIKDTNIRFDGFQLECNNIVIDPLNITIDDFKNIVDSLYMGPDYSYIVYNASFERSRLKELKGFIMEDEYDKKIDCIINNLHDLANYFNVSSNKYNQPIVIKELGGFYSIKKVLPFIEKNDPTSYKRSGSIDYHDIDKIQNGLICQTETTKRFYNLISDNEWNQLVVNLKKYCENDVRAMIAVEYYIKNLIA